MLKSAVLKRIAIAGVALVFALMVAGVGGRVAGHLLQVRYSPPGHMVPVNGRLIHLYCMGVGKPAVIIEPGTGVDWSSWYPVAPKLSEFTKVCVYDRGGYGWSESGPRPRTAAQLAAEMNGLLSAARIAPPYILVAASFGGYIAREYASRYGVSLVGAVLADPQSEGEPLSVIPMLRKIARMFPPVDFQRLPRMMEGARTLPAGLRDAPAAFQERYLIGASAGQSQAERDEVAALPETEAEVRSAQFPPELALTVITAKHLISPHEYYPPPVPEPGPIHRELHAKLAAQSSRGKLVAADNSGHMIALDQPELIVEAVREQVMEYRLNGPAHERY
jgi:pimeloyl-ACP methyl ester carboxylesterase